MNRILYIVDIKSKQYNNFDLGSMLSSNSEVLSLTPYSSYLLNLSDVKYKTFHSIVSIDDYRKEVFSSYLKIEKLFQEYKNFGYILSKLALVKNYEIFINILFKYIRDKKQNNYKIVYISDTKKEENIKIFDFKTNKVSAVYYSDIVDNFIFIDSKDYFFYFLNKLKKIYYQTIYTNDIFNKIKGKLLKAKHNILKYDHSNYYKIWHGYKPIEIKSIDLTKTFNQFEKKTRNVFISNNIEKFIEVLYENILNETKKIISENSNNSLALLKPFVYLHNYDDFIMSVIYKKNNIPRVFMQHGSYLYGHSFLEYNEIYPADVNFVFNEYTKESLLKYNPKKVYNVGSVNFNKKMKNKAIKYDFLYITHCAYYSYCGMYISIKKSNVSVDGNNIFQKHKEIIELFGNKFKAKTLCIKMQRTIVDNMLYVPLLELSRNYKNIKIEFFEPIHNLIEKAKYIISDYFSSEFINRDLHYKKNIILFSGVPYTLPEETVEDMRKMFIVVETVEDLSEKIENIEYITENRKRYDSIIEYYSSRNCDTKKVVTEILKEKLNDK